MKQMKLISADIRNFKGIKEMHVDFYSLTEIIGQNGSYKTTIGDLVNWVMFNKNIVGETKFDIRPKDADGNDIDFIDIYGKLIWLIDGEVVEIEKTQKQNWVKKRGEENQTFSGNVNSFVVNTIPKSETEFKKYMDGIISEDVFKFASNTNAFMSQKPADRRKTLFELVANIGVDEIVASNDKLLPVLADLKKHSYEELKSRTTKAISEFKKSKIEIPSRIDEVSRKIVEEDYSEIETELKKLEEELENLKAPADNSEMFEKVNAINLQIYESKEKIKQIEKDLSEEKLSRINDIGIELTECRDVLSSFTSKLQCINGDIEKYGLILEQKRKEITSLGADLEKEKLLEFDNSKLNCPVCGSSFSEDKKADMIASFEKSKAETIAKINTRGSAMKKEINELKEGIASAEETKALFIKDIEVAEKNVNEKVTELEKVKAVDVDFSKDKEWVELSALVEKLSTDLSVAKALVIEGADGNKALDEQRDLIKDKIKNANAILNGKNVVADAKLRVTELNAELREIEVKLSEQEKYAYLLDLYNRAKADLLSDEVNKHFNIVKWKLFRQLVNGGEEECCEPMVNGKPYSSGLNSGHRILAELDIINALQKIYDVQVPVILDNAERVNAFNLPKMDCQLITMRVGENKEIEIREVI